VRLLEVSPRSGQAAGTRNREVLAGAVELVETTSDDFPGGAVLRVAAFYTIQETS